MKPIERATAHFKTLSMAPIEVPEWPDDDGKATIIYSTPVTLREKQRVRAVSEEVGGVEALANILIIRARDAQGAPMFTLEDKQLLVTRTDPNVVARVAAALMGAASLEEQEKN